jgi:Uncharacterized conserved protein, COG1478
MPKLEIIPVTGLPIIEKGVDVGEIIVKAVKDMGESFIDGDILVIAHSIVSRAEGMSISLKEVVPSAFAQKIAEATGKDPRQVEVILRNCRKNS